MIKCQRQSVDYIYTIDTEIKRACRKYVQLLSQIFLASFVIIIYIPQLF